MDTRTLSDTTGRHLTRSAFLRRAGVLSLGAGGVGSFLAACGGGSGKAASAKQTWDFLWYLPQAKNPVTKSLTRFANLVDNKTDGKLDLRIRPVGELPYDATEYVRTVGQGKVELADGSSGFISGDLKVGAIPTLPFLVRTQDEMTKAMSIIQQPMEDELKGYGDDLLFWYMWPAAKIWGRGKPVKTLSDLKGKKIRTYAPMQDAFLKKLGAFPTTITTDEVAPSLQRGVIDATVTSAMTVLPLGWYQFVDWGYLVDMQVSPNYELVNGDAYSSLSSDVQQGLDAAAKDTHDYMLKHVLGTEDSYVEELRSQHNVTINELSPADLKTVFSMMKPIWANWASSQPQSVRQSFQKVRAALGR